MADFTQQPIADALAHNQQNHPFTDVGSAITPEDGALWALIHMHHAFVETGDNADPASFFIQTNLGLTDESWVTKGQFTVVDESAVVDEAMLATEPAGETALLVTSAGGFAATDYIYIQDGSVETDSEWHQIQETNGTPEIIILSPGLETGKDSSDVIFSHAQSFEMTLDLSGVARWRVVYMNEGSAARNTAWWVRYIEVTDIE